MEFLAINYQIKVFFHLFTRRLLSWLEHIVIALSHTALSLFRIKCLSPLLDLGSELFGRIVILINYQLKQEKAKNRRRMISPVLIIQQHHKGKVLTSSKWRHSSKWWKRTQMSLRLFLSPLRYPIRNYLVNLLVQSI